MKLKEETIFFLSMVQVPISYCKCQVLGIKKKITCNNLEFVQHTYPGNTNSLRKGKHCDKQTLLHLQFYIEPLWVHTEGKVNTLDACMCNPTSVCRSSALRMTGIKQKCTDTKDSSLKTTWTDRHPGEFHFWASELFADILQNVQTFYEVTLIHINVY